jgi:hypothetical protein
VKPTSVHTLNRRSPLPGGWLAAATIAAVVVCFVTTPRSIDSCRFALRSSWPLLLIPGHPGRSVLPNRSVRLLGSYANSVPRKISTDRFLKKLGTEQIRYRYFRFGSGTYRNNRTAYNNGVVVINGSGHLYCLSWRSLLRCSTARRRRRGRVGDGRMAWPLGDGVTVTARARPRRARARSRRPTGEGAVRCRGGRRATAWREGDREPPRHDRAVGEARRTKAQRGGRRAKGSREGGGAAAPA